MLAIGLLEVSLSALTTDGRDDHAWALVFSSGIIVDDGADGWWPVPRAPHPAALRLVEPGTANHTILRRIQMEEPHRILYTCTDLSLIDRAIADPVARQACSLLAQLLRVQRSEVPAALVATIQGEGLEQRRGPNTAKRAYRDRAIVQAIQALHAEFGYSITSSRRAPSAIDLVEDALKRLNVRPWLTGPRIYDIWKERHRKLTSGEEEKAREDRAKLKEWAAAQPR